MGGRITYIIPLGELISIYVCVILSKSVLTYMRTLMMHPALCMGPGLTRALPSTMASKLYWPKLWVSPTTKQSWVLKTALACHWIFVVNDGSGRGHIYRGLADGVKSIVRSDGWRGLYQVSRNSLVIQYMFIELELILFVNMGFLCCVEPQGYQSVHIVIIRPHHYTYMAIIFTGGKLSMVI